MHNMAQSLSEQGKHDEAAAMLQDVLEARKRVLGIDHPHTLATAESLESVRSKLSAAPRKPSKKGANAAARAASSPTSLADAEQRGCGGGAASNDRARRGARRDAGQVEWQVEAKVEGKAHGSLDPASGSPSRATLDLVTAVT